MEREVILDRGCSDIKDRSTSISLSDNWNKRVVKAARLTTNGNETLQPVQHSSLPRVRCAFKDVWPAVDWPINEQHSYHSPLQPKSSLETVWLIARCVLPTLNCMSFELDVAERVIIACQGVQEFGSKG